MQPKNLSFVLEEYKALRVEIDNIQKQGYAMETALILGVAGFVSFSSSEKIADALIWYLPFIITLLNNLYGHLMASTFLFPISDN